jgi:hypothetical protein
MLAEKVQNYDLIEINAATTTYGIHDKIYEREEEGALPSPLLASLPPSLGFR